MGWSNADNKYGPTQFVVGKVLGDGCNYTSIQTAINDIAALASPLGTILVRVGSYTENLTIPAATAVQILGVAGNASIDGVVTLNGSITNGAGSGCTVAHIVIVGNVVNATGAMIIQDCVVEALAGDAITISTGSADTEVYDSVVLATGGNSVAYSGGMATFINSTIDIGPIAVSGSTSFQPVFNGCEITAGAVVNTTGTSTPVFENCFFLDNSVIPFNIGPGTTVNLWHCTVDTSDGSGFWATGTGNLSYADIILTNNFAINPTVVQQVAVWEPFATTTTGGIAFFNPANFTVSAVGEVSLSSATGIVWTDRAAPVTVASNSGSNATAAVTLTLPAAPANGDVCDFLRSVAGVLVIQANAGQTIRIGSATSSVAGTATSTAIGDSIHFVYMSSSTTWYSIGGPEGTWTLA